MEELVDFEEFIVPNITTFRSSFSFHACLFRKMEEQMELARRKRADAKKALKDLLSKTTSYKMPSEDEDITWKADKTRDRNVEEDVQPRPEKSTGKNKSRRSSHFGEWQQTAIKNKQRKGGFFDDYDEHPQTIFQATYGNRSFTWTLRSCYVCLENPTFGFEWRDNSHWTNNKRREWEHNESDVDEPSVIGSHSDRTVLGLPPTGPLKMEDVKSAFRASALKWQPDKHQGPSQVVAEEKFKLCVDAYRSLCSALS